MFLSLARAWQQGAQHESDWWSQAVREAVATRSQDDQFFVRLRGEMTFDFAQYVEHVSHDPIRVLDVGAGPVSQVGTVYPGRSIDLVPVDPLAERYDDLLSELGLRPKYPTTIGVAERLDDLLAEDSFDFAYCRNALDHAYDPLMGISQVMRVLRPGCAFFLSGHRNEAEKVNYVGLHQWNFEIRGGSLMLWRPGIQIDVGEALSPELDIVWAEGENWYTVVMQKKGNP